MRSSHISELSKEQGLGKREDTGQTAGVLGQSSGQFFPDLKFSE